MTRRPIILLIVLLAIATALWAWWTREGRERPRIYNGPMVQMVTTEGFTLTWQIAPDLPATVTLLDPNGFDLASFEPTRILDPVTSAQTRWRCDVRNLKPGLTYRYRISVTTPSAGDIVAAENAIRTAGERGQPFRFLALGDTGTGRWPQYRVARQLTTWQPDLVLHTGDIVTPKALREELPAKLFAPYTDLFASTPMYPCLGNHDCRVEQGQPILDTFIFPDNGPPGEAVGRHYWFDWADARFIVVDSNHHYPYFRDGVAPWLDRVLADAGDRWTIAVWHEPVVTNGSKYPPAEKLLLSLVPILDKHRCTLVLNGHQHGYERSRPIRAGRIVAEGAGTVYVVTAAGGCNLYEQKNPRSQTIAAFCDIQHSFTVVDVTPGRLAVRQIGDNNRQIDEYHIEKRAIMPDRSLKTP